MNEIQKTTSALPVELIEKAITGGADLTQLEKLLEMQFRWEANEARKAYHLALATAKSKIPQIIRDKKNAQYNSTYASKNQIMKTITPILSKHGISATFQYSTPSEKSVTVTCRLTHKHGHSEETSFTAPADISGAKNPIQQLKSTRTYLEKMTLEGVLGIESEDETDDDGNAVGASYVSEEQLKEIIDLLAETKSDNTKFMKFMGVQFPDEILAKDYTKAIAALNAKKNAGGKK